MGWWFGIEWSYRLVVSDKENIVLLVWCGVKFYFVLMAWIDYPTLLHNVLDNRQVLINNTCCVNSRLLVIRYRTITTRTIYCTVCALCRTIIVAVSSTLLRSILYYVEIVGNCLYSWSWSSYKLFTIIVKIHLIKI